MHQLLLLADLGSLFIEKKNKKRNLIKPKTSKNNKTASCGKLINKKHVFSDTRNGT
jgi:hypothetical protein